MKKILTIISILFTINSFSQSPIITDIKPHEKSPSVGISILYGDGQMLDYGQFGLMGFCKITRKLRVYGQYVGSIGGSDVPWVNISDWTDKTHTQDYSWRSELYSGSLPESYMDIDYDQYESFGEIEQKKSTATGGAMIQISKRSSPFSTHLRLGLGVTSYNKIRLKQVEDTYFTHEHWDWIGQDEYYSDSFSSYSIVSEEKMKKITGELGLDFFLTPSGGFGFIFGTSYQISPSSLNLHMGLCF